MTLCLTKDELADLTGFKRRTKQIAALKNRGIRHFVTQRGHVKVIRSDAFPSPGPQQVDPYPAPLPSPMLDGPASIFEEDCVYFIQFTSHKGRGLIKIGFSKHLRARRHQIAAEFSGDPRNFESLGSIPGSMTLEAALHRRFHQARVFGEWFVPTRRLRRFIATAHARKTR